MTSPCAHPRFSPRPNGFTLLEMVIALAVFSVIATLGVQLIGTSLEAYNESAPRLRTLGDLRYAMQRIGRELRETRGADITIFQPTSMVFTKLDGTQVGIGIGATSLDLSYSTLNAGQVYALSNNLSGLALAYYDANGAVTAVASAIAFVEVDITLSYDGTVFQQRNRYALRNG